MESGPRLTSTMRLTITVLVVAFITLSCSLPTQIKNAQSAPTQDLGLQLTSQALNQQATALAEQQATLNAQSKENQATEKVEVKVEPTTTPAPTETQAPAEPTTAPTDTEVPPEPTMDLEEKMKSANILVFEDTQKIGNWIQQSLDSAGYDYVHVGDAVGHFMENLNSGIDWDLIIVGAETKSGVRGEFWDEISDQLDRGASVIVEIWYLDQTINGRIKPLLTRCGVDYQKDIPVADSIYWLDPTHPLFNEPNTVMPLLHYSRYWTTQSGDLLKLREGSNATLLAGTQKNRKSDYGQIATCLDGQLIIQTFSNHDYPRSDILLLWQNYVEYGLKKRFSIQE